MLVFVGEEQNKGKTTFCRWLCPQILKDYYTEEMTQGKDEYLQLVSNFLVVYDDFDKLYRNSLESIKSILSKTTVKFRLPYAKREQMFSRTCSFIGSTNQTQFLTDETGSIRFLSFLLKGIDFNYSKDIDINKIYAQAYYLYKFNNDYEMTKEEQTALQDYNRQFFVATTEHDVIQEYIRIPDKHDYSSNSTTTIYQWQTAQILQFLQDNITNIKLNSISLGKSLKFLGFEKRKVRNKIGTVYAFEVCINYERAVIRESLKECFLKK